MKKIKRGKQSKNKKQKAENFYKRNFLLSWQYVKESKNYIWFIVAVFLASALLAFIYQPPEIVELIREFIEKLMAETQDLNTGQMMLFIFDNNLRTSFFSMLLGVFLGIFPFLAAFSNGYVLGFVAQKSIAIEGGLSLWRLLPHGVFEFPAVVLSLALGVKFGMFVLEKGRRKKEFIRRAKESLRVFFFIVLPLLIIAAIIEGLLIGLLK